MKIAVVGGALQGLEVIYLAKKAGFETLLFDRKDPVPAAGLCGEFRQLDVLDPGALDQKMKGVDLVFPALESPAALAVLHRWAAQNGMPIIHDPDAYAVSSSKIASDKFFREFGFPVPAPWPGCNFPAIAKPSGGSGSRGIRVFASHSELRHALGDDPLAGGWMVQSFVPGPTYSVEVMRLQGITTAFPVTDLHMDAVYDCKRVSAPSRLPAAAQEDLKALSIAIANALDLDGIMDVEAVYRDGVFKVLEIDARFPSQTPAAVYGSCGINMVAALVEGVLEKKDTNALPVEGICRGTVLEHIRVTPGSLVVAGEHVLAEAASLALEPGFFGAQEAITDYGPGKTSWTATLICTGEDVDAAWGRRNATVSEIQRRFGLKHYEDPHPAAIRTEAPP